MKDDELERRLAWVNTIRAMHRQKRFAGYLGCLAGIIVVLWGRFGQGAPDWAIPVGLAIIFASWLLFVYVLWDRWRWAKANDPSRANASN